MNEFKDFIRNIYDFLKNIVMSCYNFLNHYIPSQVLFVIGVVLAAFIICVIFRKITER